nr:FAD-dependent oxidoreductase [Ignavibacteriaceae bacterium]
DEQKAEYNLKANLFFYPLNILSALLKYSAFSLDERIRVILFAIKLFFTNPDSIKEENIKQWLFKNLQTEKINKALWEIIAVGALNSSLDKSSPKIFASILKKIFFSGNFSSTIVLPKVGLSELFCVPTEIFFDETNNKIVYSEKLMEVSIENERVIKVQTSKREITDFDYLILAVPFFGIEKIVGLPVDLYSVGKGLSYSSIVGCHIFIKDFQLEKDFYALLNSTVHWVFNHKSHLTIVISDSDYLISKSNEEIKRIIFTELQKHLGLEESNILSSKIIKEKRATFIPDQKSIKVRPSVKTSVSNLLLAGDWIQTELPATIESAVLSGRLAAEAVVNEDEN